MNERISILETTLEMLGAREYLPNFKKYKIDSSVLPLLTEDDLKIIGVEDEHLRNNLIKQCTKLPLLNTEQDMQVNEAFLIKVLQETNHHLLLLDASLSYALNHPDTLLCDIKVHKASECLLTCITSLQKECQNFHRIFSPRKHKKNRKWTLTFLTIISASATAYFFKRYFL